MPDDLTNKNKDLWTKLMFGVLVFFGISALILGILQTTKTINLEDDYGTSEAEVDFNDIKDILEREQQTIQELQATDTDGDGLSDFDEMYVYKTSMYLADSDSDGYDDKAEIDGGYDPNCPKGSDCRGLATDTNQPLNTGQYEENNIVPAGTEQELSDELKNELQNLSADEVRQLLIESGAASAEDLAGVDDETLMAVFYDILKQ